MNAGSVPLTRLIDHFEVLKTQRRTLLPDQVLSDVGSFAKEAHSVLLTLAEPHSVAWQGQGDKSYRVYTEIGHSRTWSRAVNEDLFIESHADFVNAWDAFEAACNDAADRLSLSGYPPYEVDRVLYTAVMSWAVGVDLFKPSRGLGGTYFEMLVGPVVSLLSGLPETGDVTIRLPDGLGTEVVKVDLTFHNEERGRSLAIPTKISTRERVSQPYVHARILEAAFPGRYATVLCVVNENNAFHERGTPVALRSVHSLYLSDTLVPGTIALYQKYIAGLAGLYYLDPPYRYVNDTPAGFPNVGTLGEMLVEDLPGLL